MTGTPPTDQQVSLQTGDSVSAVTEDRVNDLIEEFVNAAILPWQKKIKETATRSIEMIESTNKELQTAVGRITSVEDKYNMTDLLYSDNTNRTKALEAVTKKLEADLALTRQKVSMTELNQLSTDQKLKKIDGDLAQSGVQAGSTLERVAMLEEKHAKTEVDLKAVNEQLAEMIAAKLAADKALEEANELAAQKIQDALDEQTRLQKETAEEDANLAGHLETLENIAPTVAVQQNEDAARLIVQQSPYNEFVEAHKKSKAVSSPSGPVTRKRKNSSKRAAISKLIDGVTETVVDPQINPVLQADEELEEEKESIPLNKRPRGLDAIPIRSFVPPASPFTGTSGGQGSSSRPVPAVKGKAAEDHPTRSFHSGINQRRNPPDAERRLLAQHVQENPLLEEEEVIVQEPKQALPTHEEEVVEEEVIEESGQAPNDEEAMKSPVVRSEEAQEKEVEVT
ncbi:myosin heavy chain, fast skeletal muscle-like [Impatiens glandulifera]|uniref:myosin heavy chain, fast skeletal muscle-like n=1 Tax=Impatiens glandulifera TaxID=253017 RepID=UPI001FB111C7|nr:myosin heavy chain, fast skeletal muscle-like [Impatiens glandulifera]